jgi:hypothetical protein
MTRWQITGAATKARKLVKIVYLGRARALSYE